MRLTALTLGVLLAASPSLAAPADRLAPTAAWSAHASGPARTPPMGWSSWNAFFTNIDEDKLLGSARRIVDSGLAVKGYRYINIDDGWWLKRRVSDGRLIPRVEKFPSAVRGPGDPSLRPLTDRLHAMGLKAGIYSDLGRNICSQAYMPDEPLLPQGSVAEREVGLYGHIDQDIGLFFDEWGFDFIKVDGCGVRAFGPDTALAKSGKYRALAPLIDVDSVSRTDIPAVQALFGQINAALARHNADGDYLLSLCVWGSADVRAWGKDVGAMSRTSDDISPHWGRMLSNYDSAVRRALYAHPGSWNDPDMLFIGSGDFDEAHLTEARSHFALWAMLNAPLMIGMDLRKASPALMEVFGASDLIAVNQDPAGNQAVIAYDSDAAQILVKTLANGDKAVAIFNRGLAPIDATLTAEHLKFRDDAEVRLTNLWTGEHDRFTKEKPFHVAPRQTLVFRAKGARSLADGLYLSEQPGVVNPAVDGVERPQADPTIFRSVIAWRSTRGAGERPTYAGWGGAQADATPYGQTLKIAGRAFASGIGVLANSRLEVRNLGFDRLTASVGVDDSARDEAGQVSFIVYGDGKPLARIANLRQGQAARTLDVDVKGVRIIELVASAPGANTERLPVTWGDAALRR